MKRLAILFVASFAPAWAMSADLLDVYRDALANDAQYAAARAELQAGQERRIQGRAGLLPNLQATAGVSRDRTDPSSGAASTHNTSSWGVQLTQPLFRQQNFIEARQGDLQTSVADVEFEQARQDLILRVSEAYFNVLNAQDALDALRQLREASREQLEIAEASFEVGTVTITDVHEARSRSDLADAQVIAAESDLAVQRDILARIIGREPDTLATLRDDIQLELPEPADQQMWVEAAREGSYVVQAQQLGQQIATREVERNRAGHLPTLDLVAGHSYARNPNNLQGPRTRSSSVGVEMNLPLYSGGAVSSLTREAAALKTRADANLDEARRTAALNAREAYLGVSSGISRIRALEAAEVSSLSSLEANRLGYEVGVRINIDVLNALSQLAETRQDLARARYDTLISQLRLKAASGALDEDELVVINTLLTERDEAAALDTDSDGQETIR